MSGSPVFQLDHYFVDVPKQALFEASFCCIVFLKILTAVNTYSLFWTLLMVEIYFLVWVYLALSSLTCPYNPSTTEVSWPHCAPPVSLCARLSCNLLNSNSSLVFLKVFKRFLGFLFLGKGFLFVCLFVHLFCFLFVCFLDIGWLCLTPFFCKMKTSTLWKTA